MQELDETTVSRAKIVLDTVHALDAGDLQIPLKSQKIEKDKHVLGELGEVIVRGVQVSPLQHHSLHHSFVFFLSGSYSRY